ncbi:MAG TPA: RHS repeat domain-containing protein, partial [Thermoguttaceae bacterium]|nr:RHS repeat domain-containing protein [Thermoguttaceae bacterium]
MNNGCIGTYDAAGNMTAGPKPGDEAQSDGTEHEYTFDAWNRLVEVTDDAGTPATIAEYRYDGLGRRIVKVDDSAEGDPRYLGAGWPRVIAHPGLPQIRTCRITASGSSSQGFATCGNVPARSRVGKVPGASPISLSVGITVTRQRMSGIRGGSCRRVHDLTPRFPPTGPRGSSSP